METTKALRRGKLTVLQLLGSEHISHLVQRDENWAVVAQELL